MRTLNLGILAHVDAGKTTLTQRLLHAAGAIDEIGSVDDGSTQNDNLTLEPQRGITIRSAVLEYAFDFDSYQPVRDEVPVRPRLDHNPLNRKEYLLRLARRVWCGGRRACAPTECTPTR